MNDATPEPVLTPREIRILTEKLIREHDNYMYGDYNPYAEEDEWDSSYC